MCLVQSGNSLHWAITDLQSVLFNEDWKFMPVFF
jgi:hypothetical protein